MSLNLSNQEELFTADKTLENYLKPGSPMVLFSKEINPLFQDEDFKDFYSTRGRNGISPALLAKVTLLQFRENLSDVEAKEACNLRIDWKIALRIGLEEYLDFDPSTLCNFRKRLRENDALSMIFDKTVQLAKEKGLIKKKTNQRIDATHVIAHVNRIATTDLLFRTVKCLVEEIEKNDPVLYKQRVPHDIKERYTNDFSSFGMSKEKRADKQSEIVEDGLYLKKFLSDLPEEHQGVYRQLPIMGKVFEENIIITKKKISNKEFIEVKEIQRPKQSIFNPRDTNLAMGVKGKTRWVGSKCHIVETAEKNQTNIITGMIYQTANEYDNKILEKVGELNEKVGVNGEKLFCDSAYISGKTMAEFEAKGQRLMGYIQKENSPRPDGFKVTDFDVDVDKQTAICPAKQKTMVFAKQSDRRMLVKFPRKICSQCPHFRICVGKGKNGDGGRTLCIAEHHKQIQRRRKEQKTEEFKAEMKIRAQVEATISEAVRFHGLRKKKYKGAIGDTLQFYLTGAAINMKRILRVLSVRMGNILWSNMI